VFENTKTYRRKSHAVIGRCLLFEISRPWNDAVTTKLIEVYELIDLYMFQVIRIIKTEFCPELSKWVLIT